MNSMIYDTSSLIFLSTLSLRRATNSVCLIVHIGGFLSTLSLRRATYQRAERQANQSISIHALLAESDRAENHANSQREFLSTLSLRRATREREPALSQSSISIHALLAESDQANAVDQILPGHISIHALLAESDCSL